MRHDRWLARSFDSIKEPPKLIITDSQAFGPVFAQKPAASAITSFSVLFAHYKGDAAFFASGAEAVENLSENSRVLLQKPVHIHHKRKTLAV